MAAPRIPTWKERLAACFRWRHRLLHVFGAPSAAGAVAAVAGAAALAPEVGLALGALTAGTLAVLSGYYVVAGFDRGLVTQLQGEEIEQARSREQAETARLVASAGPALRGQVERCLALHDAVEAVFADGIDDAVEAILQNSRADLASLRARALSMLKLHQRLGAIVQQSNEAALHAELKRLDRELSSTPEGPVRDAMLAARESSVRALEQWRNAADKQRQVENVLTLIENSLQEFKLAMELRKADATLGSRATGRDVSELQGRLIAAGQACDELVGVGPTPAAHRRERRRVS